MAPRFKEKVLQTSKLIKNTTIVSILLLSFFLVLFSKSDIFIISSIKNIYLNHLIVVGDTISVKYPLGKQIRMFKNILRGMHILVRLSSMIIILNYLVLIDF